MRKKATLRAELNLAAVEKKLWGRLNELRKKQKFVRMSDYKLKVEQALKLLAVAHEQLSSGFIVQFPEHALARKLQVKQSRVRELKRFLREAGIMFVPSAMRPKAAWHAGKWLIRKAFLRFYMADENGVVVAPRAKRQVTVRKRALRWSPEYYVIRSQAVLNVRAEIRVLVDGGMAQPSIRSRMMRINRELQRIVLQSGRTLSALAWNPPAPKSEHVVALSVAKNFLKVSPQLRALPLVSGELSSLVAA